MEDRPRPRSSVDLGDLEDRLGLTFESHALLEEALTHRSYAFEQSSGTHNERLEFLGDAVLGLIVTDVIFADYPGLPEGELAKLRSGTVNAGVLAEIARAIGLGEFLLLGRGETLSGGSDKGSILADALEAVLGAVYLDRGLGAARQFVELHFAAHIRSEAESENIRDFKTALQEEASRRAGILPEYRITASGPDHAKKFQARVFVGDDELGQGEGGSKKEAEQRAAERALGMYGL